MVSHHLIGYSPGPPAPAYTTTSHLEKIKRQAVYHLMQYMKTAQNGNGLHNAQTDDTPVDIPPDLARYMELQKLLIESRRDLLRLARPTNSAKLDSPNILQ